MTTSAWGVDHLDDIEKGWTSDKPKVRGIAIDDGHPIDTVNLRNTGKKTMLRRRPKYEMTAFSSQNGGGYSRVTRTKPNKAGKKALTEHISSGRDKSKIGGVTYVGKSLTDTESTMSTSAWGVEHGSEVSKADQGRTRKGHLALAGASGAWNPTVSTIHGAATAKKGKRAKSAFVQGGASTVGAVAGGILGGKAGAAGLGLGSMAGGAAGSVVGAKRNINQGRVKITKPKKSI